MTQAQRKHFFANLDFRNKSKKAAKIDSFLTQTNILKEVYFFMFPIN